MSDTDGRVTRWAGQRERRRTEFVDAALEAIAKHGPEVSTAQIAEHAGVARPKIYRHFADKADLDAAISQRAAEVIIAELDPVWNPQGSPIEMIELAVRTHVRWMAEHGPIYQYVVNLAANTGGTTYSDVMAAVSSHIAGLFRSYCDALGLDPAAAEPAAYGLVGFVDAATGRWLENPGDQSRERLTARLVSWAWLVIDDVFAAADPPLDPHQPLPSADELKRQRASG